MHPIDHLFIILRECCVTIISLRVILIYVTAALNGGPEGIHEVRRKVHSLEDSSIELVVVVNRPPLLSSYPLQLHAFKSNIKHRITRLSYLQSISQLPTPPIQPAAYCSSWPLRYAKSIQKTRRRTYQSDSPADTIKKNWQCEPERCFLTFIEQHAQSELDHLHSGPFSLAEKFYLAIALENGYGPDFTENLCGLIILSKNSKGEIEIDLDNPNEGNLDTPSVS